MPNVDSVAMQLYEQGWQHRIDGDYEQAVACLQQALALEPNDAQLHLELGLAYCFSGLFDESIQEMETAAKLDAADPEIHLHLGKTYTMLGMYDEGAATFRRVLAIATPGDKHYAEAEKQLAYFTAM